MTAAPIMFFTSVGILVLLVVWVELTRERCYSCKTLGEDCYSGLKEGLCPTCLQWAWKPEDA